MGTRPEIIKLAPVIKELRARGHTVTTVATGQHHDETMAGRFFADLDLRPDMVWDLPAGEAARVGSILQLSFELMADERPDAVLCLGDTYTVPMFCMSARRRAVPVVHLEAGLRSFNPTSMEEVNRRIAAATASYHMAPTEMAARFLLSEGVDEQRVSVVGNPVLDVLRASGITPRPAAGRHGVVLTAHRATNVDDPARRRQLVKLVVALADHVGPVRFPVHPRTRALLEQDGLITRLDRPGVRMTAPMGYEEMLESVTSARVVVTDSGGLQEEASWLRVPVVVLRRSTPRWEGVMAGTSVLVGMDADLALAQAQRLAGPDIQALAMDTPCPYGDGHTSQRVADLLDEDAVRERLLLVEPDFVERALPW